MRAFGVAHINIVVRPHNEGALSNSVTVSSSESDPVLSNNTAATTNTVTRLADLIVRNNDSPDPIPQGGSTTYTITVTNRGPSAATGVTVHTQPNPSAKVIESTNRPISLYDQTHNQVSITV